MSYRTQRGRNRLGGLGYGEPERRNIIQPDLSSITVSDRVLQLSLTVATLSPKVEERIKWHLGEIAKTRFEDNALQIAAYASALEKEKDGRLLALILDLVFRNIRAKPELSMVHIFTRLCHLIAQDVLPTIQDQQTLDANGQPVLGSSLVRMYLADRCYKETKQTWDDRQAALSRAWSASGDKLGEASAAAETADQIWLAMVRFIHSLYQQSLVVEEPVHRCVERLLALPAHKHAEAVTLYNVLLEPKGSRIYQDRDRMDRYYMQIQKLIRTTDLGEAKVVFESTLNEWNNPPDAEKIFALRAKLEEYKSNTVTVEQANPPRTIELSSNEQSHAARTKDADDGSKLKITATTPLSVVMDIFNSFAKINDYTSELRVESNNTVDPIAYGGYSDVYRATLRKGTHVAVKCMRSSVTGDYNAVKRTARELDTWSQLRHQNILELLGMAIFRGQLAMVSLWMDRGNVVAMVNNETNANILVAIDGTPKITDFGLAVICDGVFDYSATNGGGGTTRWMVNTRAFHDAGP
ncbi:hypothetical protein FRC09_000735 [Ceratobasidium sp. 395]|nr:hypothetical protein FRC09_000735 [Ceratobasidium sp. 395]